MPGFYAQQAYGFKADDWVEVDVSTQDYDLSTELTPTQRQQVVGIYVNDVSGGNDIALESDYGSSSLFELPSNGSVLNIIPKVILSTNTTVTGIRLLLRKDSSRG